MKRQESCCSTTCRIVLNVSGSTFETLESTLDRFPATLLGNRSERARYIYGDNTLFFDRNRLAFEAILFFYQSQGRLEKPVELDTDVFEEECLYFGLPRESIESMKKRENKIVDDFINDDLKAYHGKGCELWYFLDEPQSSRAASVYAVFSILVVIASVFMTCLETIPSIQNHFQQFYSRRQNWLRTELAINVFFLSEFVLRCILAPNKRQFVKSILNWFDMLAVVPYFLTLSISEVYSSVRVFRILRFFRIIRLFRITKYSRHLRLIGTIFAASFSDLKLLVLCLLMAVTFGGSLLYFSESNVPDTAFDSIPQSLWWAVQTIVVLGYGDIVPVTLQGKLLASAFMVFGALTISLPVLSVVTRFTEVYGLHMRRRT